MTKAVRIENADLSDHKISIFAETKNETGEWVREQASVGLNNPTEMFRATIWKGRRIVIEEVE